MLNIVNLQFPLSTLYLLLLCLNGVSLKISTHSFYSQTEPVIYITM